MYRKYIALFIKPVCSSYLKPTGPQCSPGSLWLRIRYRVLSDAGDLPIPAPALRDGEIQRLLQDRDVHDPGDHLGLRNVLLPVRPCALQLGTTLRRGEFGGCPKPTNQSAARPASPPWQPRRRVTPSPGAALIPAVTARPSRPQSPSAQRLIAHSLRGGP